MFGGTQADYIMHKLSYKEAIALREARINRKEREFKEEEEMRKRQLKK